jgi:hypothetical protein
MADGFTEMWPQVGSAGQAEGLLFGVAEECAQCDQLCRTDQAVDGRLCSTCIAGQCGCLIGIQPEGDESRLQCFRGWARLVAGLRGGQPAPFGRRLAHGLQLFGQLTTAVTGKGLRVEVSQGGRQWQGGGWNLLAGSALQHLGEHRKGRAGIADRMVKDEGDDPVTVVIRQVTGTYQWRLAEWKRLDDVLCQRCSPVDGSDGSKRYALW